MTWILASSLLLGAALVAGFAWYERTHPTTRVLALVATLAALAALGRIAFAPLPNVKPTTDIVLIAGYVLGGAPGLRGRRRRRARVQPVLRPGPVDAVADGRPGARVGVARRAARAAREPRRPAASRSRSPAALAGLAFGAVMNLHMWVTYSGDHTLAKLGAYFATSLPFDLAHALGNVVFCLAFGPALVRALQRFRTRMEVTWLPAPGGGRPWRAAALLALVLARRRRRRARAGPERRRGRRQGVAALPRRRPERRRRLGRRARPVLDAAPHGLDRARPRRRRAQPARRRRHDRDRLHARPRRASSTTSASSRARSSSSRAAGLSPRDVGGRDLVAELLRKRKAERQLRRAASTRPRSPRWR